MSKGLEDLVDLMFDTDMEEVMKEKSTLEYIHKLQQENKQLKERFERLKQEHIDTITRNEEKQQRIDKAIEYIKTQQVIFKDYDIAVDNQLKNILEILGDKENE